MTLPTESVTQTGSGLVVVNSYDASVTQAYRSAIITAENQLQHDFTSQLTINARFTLAPLSSDIAAQNDYSAITVSYAQFTRALQLHAATADAQLAANGLPISDPSASAGFELPLAYAQMLGLTPQTNDHDITVTLNSSLSWSYGQDAVGAIQHELTEGGFGRVGSLGFASPQWGPLDLFRFTAAGQRDYTGGQDGAATFFGLDSAHVSSLAYHSGVSVAGAFDQQDLGDWSAGGDIFGPGGPGSSASLSATDLQVLNALGWNTATFTPAADDFANSLTDTSHPFGHVAVGSQAAGTLQQAGDRDWFQVNLQQGATYTLRLLGQASGGGTLTDPYLRLHDASGAVLTVNDDLSGSNPDSQIVFTAPSSGVYYAEAGGFVDGYAGTYTMSLSQTGQAAANIGTSAGDVLQGANGGDTVNGQAGDDTITGGTGSNVLLGGDGNDSVVGGSGFNAINGNKGDDTIVGNSQVGDWLLGGQGNDSVVAHSSAHNLINGNIGNDTLVAGSGGDTLRGGQNDDVILGGAGNDWLSGDRGHDTVTGGGGADIFHTGPGLGVSTVTDFSQAQGDRVQLDVGSHAAITQSGPDVLIDLGGGTQMILQNVQYNTLTPGWLFYA